MTFSTIKTMVAEMLGLDITQADEDAKVGRWVNSVYKSILGSWDWPWLEEREVVSGETEITTGTVTVTQDSTAITFSSAPATSVAGYFFQTEEAKDWYKIASHTAAATAATLETAYVQTGGSGKTYTVRRVFYSLSSSADRIISVRQMVSPTKLKNITPRRFDAVHPDMVTTGDPRWYYIYGRDSSKNWRMVFFPVISQRLLIEVRYYKNVDDLSADGDTPDMPERFHEALVHGTITRYGSKYISDPELYLASREDFKDLVESMREEAEPNKDSQHVRRSDDSDLLDLTIPKFPAAFGPDEEF